MAIVASLLNSKLAGKLTLPSKGWKSTLIVETATGIIERSTTTLFASIFFLFLASVNAIAPAKTSNDNVMMKDFFMGLKIRIG